MTIRKIRSSLGVFILFSVILPLFTTVATTEAKTAVEKELTVLELQNGFEAARAGDLAKLKPLSKSKVFLNVKNDAGYTAFVLAAYHGQKEAVRLLIDAGADPCVTDDKGNTALMGTIFKGEPGVFDLLLAKCDVNHRNRAGQPPLMYASLFGREDMAKKLMSNGAKVDLKDQDGHTATELAESQWNQSMAKILKTFGVISK